MDMLHFCTDSRHGSRSHWKYEETKVPISLFYKEPNDPSKGMFKRCLDCRIYNRQCTAAKKAKPIPEGMFLCGRCTLHLDLTEQATRKNGKKSTQCHRCYRQTGVEKTAKKLEILYELKYNRIVKQRSSCARCSRIFLKPLHENEGVRMLENINGYVLYNEVEYDVNEFLVKFKNELELRIIDFDHLTKEELLARGIIETDTDYEQKKDTVYGQKLKNMKPESERCQACCKNCHLDITIEREKGTMPTGRLTLVKRIFNDWYKMRICCSTCGIKHTHPRYLDFDHIDPKNKVDSISRLVHNNNIEFVVLAQEYPKTRPSCKFCHAIHTSNQHRDNLLRSFVRDETKAPTRKPKLSKNQESPTQQKSTKKKGSAKQKQQKSSKRKKSLVKVESTLILNIIPKKQKTSK